MTVRIGIVPSLIDGQFRLAEAYVQQIENAGGLPFLLPASGSARAQADCLSGLLLTGGGDLWPDYYGESLLVPESLLNRVDRRRTDHERALLSAVIEAGKPVFAICYGMQLLNVHFGGTLYQDIALQYAQERKPAVDHSTGVHTVELLDSGCICLSRTSAEVNSSHHQAVKQPGDGLEVFARAADGIVEGIVRLDAPFCVGVQWHPERMPGDPLSAELFHMFVRAAGS